MALLEKDANNAFPPRLTCGNVGKLQRIASALPKSSFAAMAGKSDFCLPAIVAGSNGVIAALANIVPKLHSELLRLYESGDLKSAIELQSKLSHADWALSKLGVAGVKKSVSAHFGYGSGRSRRPLGSGPAEIVAEIAEPIDVVVALEKGLK
jgi:2-keto-3-deoxy-L-rhamnonate aldolase